LNQESGRQARRAVSPANVKAVAGKRTAKPWRHRASGKALELLPIESIGYQIRATHRLLHRCLQARIEPSGATLGTWYFMRALWQEDGLTRRQLSNRVGTMEPTRLSAILIMQKKGLIRRVRNRGRSAETACSSHG
jgi:hypothetical protein